MASKSEEKIILAPIHFPKKLLNRFIFETLENIFRRQVYIASPKVDMHPFLDPAREQYQSTGILKHFIKTTPSGESKICLLVEEDLFIPVLTFVFGEAHMHGQFAIVSSHRLKEQFYLREENLKLLEQRLLKEIVHEHGHTFGLIHCMNDRCVMHNSYSVEDTDHKDIYPCEVCFEKLDETF